MKQSLSLALANSLFILSMLLVLLIGSLIQYRHFSLGLIATEFLFILLPSVVFLKLNEVPLRQGFRLNRIEGLTALSCLLLGICTFLVCNPIEVMMILVTGRPSVGLSSESLPQGSAAWILFFTAISISCPICEEVLFRGAIQGAYERYCSTAYAIGVPGIMFAFYHMRLTGLPALLALSFVLSYVAWCTRSIYATMLVHFGVNSSSALNTYLAVHGIIGFPVVSLWTALPGLLGGAILLYFIHHLRGLPDGSVPEEPSATAVH